MKLKTSILFLTYIYFALNNLSAQPNKNLYQEFNKGFALVVETPDSALILFNQIYEEARQEGDTLLMTKCMIELGGINFLNLNNPDALQQFSEALFLAEKANLELEKASALSKLGQLYRRFGKNELGEDYLTQAHLLIKSLYREDKEVIDKLIGSYRDLCSIRKSEGRYDKALLYLDSCYIYSDKTKRTEQQMAYLHLEKVGLLIEEEKYDEALEILYPLEELYDSLLSTNERYTTNTSMQSFACSYIGRIMNIQGKDDKALHYYNKALRSNQNHNMHLGNQAYLLQIIANIYVGKGDYKSAYSNLLEAKRLNDKYFRVTNKRNSNVLSIKDSYREELKKKEEELILQNMELLEKEKAIIRFRGLIGFIALIIILGIALARNRLQKLEFKNKQLIAQQKAEEKQRNTEALVNVKNKELTSYTLQLIERDDLLDKFVEHLKSNDKTPAGKSLQITRKQLNSNNWEEFNSRFVSVNRGFYERLQEKYPELTQTDLKHCALIKLNFSGKEMANLLGISEKSVHMARYRIRKKLGLQTEDNLSKFIGDV